MGETLSPVKQDEEDKDVSPTSLCTINKDTIPLKLVLFLYSGAMAAILPYLTIHMQVIGITIQETAIIYAVLPFTSFIGPPLMGFLADKLGQYKTVLILSTIANGVFHTSLLAVPVYRETDIMQSVLLKWDSVTNEVYFHPNGSQNCETFTTEFSERILKMLEEPNFKSQISKCISLPNNTNESVTSETGFCRINNRNSEFYEFLCNSLKTTHQSDVQQLKLIANFGIDNMQSPIQDCKLRTNFTERKFIGESSVSCETDLVFPTGELIIEGSNAVTFWVYFLFRILATLFMSSCFSLLDATTLAVVKMSGQADYGRERIFSVLGFGVVSPIAGLLVDQISRSKGYTDYSAAFYLSNFLLVLNVITYFLMNLHVEKPEKGIAKNVRNLLKYPEVVVFLFMMFILGSMWGFVESYLFIFLKELKAPNYLLGLTLTVGSVAGIPFSYGSGKILRYFGRVNIIIAAFIAYFVRFFGYSYITNPFWCFPFEAMEALTYHMMWIAAATYCSELAPKGLLATLMGVMGSLHYSLGKGNGAFIGGFMMGVVGTRLSFRYFGLVAGGFGVIYFLLQYCWLRKAIRRRHENDEVENSESQEKTSEKAFPVEIIYPNLDEKQNNKNFNEDDKKDLGASEAMLKNYISD